MFVSIPARRGSALAVATLVLGTALTGCADATSTDDTTQVLASFYPLQYVAEQIGGDLVTVSSLTPTGAEPHDLELSPAHARSVGDAGLVVYLSGFQPAVDDAIEARQPEHVVDAAASADLEQHGEDTDAGLDPHFWLDPLRLAAVAVDVEAELAAVDPANADAYAERADALVASLTDLDAQLTTGLAECTDRVIVTSHEAFGYFAERYGFDLVGIAGIDPDTEPSPARLREVSTIIEDNGVSTIYLERLLSSKVTDTLAADVGVATAVLDPLESLSDAGSDYRSVMLTNLATLRTGQGCA
ncbi:metal ABC transporter substrate-binding protein [Sanguibacter antarcticus]|uniref:Zinc transport system substrate-binding protein n=1 Tax=Sanguibacter antarcticus TaxID=372484 RepID=A0A2A9E2D5_9MICO|nr:metal ABC transporter substrate-binding protein [Sanguibacter antarcticus]PFG32816.1 zinc transport system substrate-binding protein [Sanguibacter antarcticus]